MALEKRYDCVRPECHFDYDVFEYYVNTQSNPEMYFKKETEVYDYFRDWDSWGHIDTEYVGPISSNAEEWEKERIPPPNLLTKKYDSYGFRYASDIGVGNPDNVWYSHTDLDLDMMGFIKTEIRDPIIEKVSIAKELEDVYKQCQTYKRAVENEIITEEEIPPVPGISGFTYDCLQFSCEEVQYAINEIPLECTLVREILGDDYVGGDLSKYWWYGWLPSQWLGKLSSGDAISSGGNTAGVPSLHESVSPPYQEIIGQQYGCPLEAEEGESSSVEGLNYGPHYGAFGGYTASPCGCIENPEGLKPKYIEECNFPMNGMYYTEYLEYVRSVGARYWNTPPKTPLLRNAQMKLLMSQQITFTAPGVRKLFVGDIVELNFPPASYSSEDGLDHSLNTANGKWLVSRINHTFDSSMRHTSTITCIRDSGPLLNGSNGSNGSDSEDDEYEHPRSKIDTLGFGWQYSNVEKSLGLGNGEEEQ